VCSPFTLLADLTPIKPRHALLPAHPSSLAPENYRHPSYIVSASENTKLTATAVPFIIRHIRFLNQLLHISLLCLHDPTTTVERSAGKRPVIVDVIAPSAAITKWPTACWFGAYVKSHWIWLSALWRPQLPYGYSYKASCASRHLYFLTSGHSDAQGWVSECSDVKNYEWRLDPVWHRTPYSCTHMATEGVRG